jgi:hypothetical protein
MIKKLLITVFVCLSLEMGIEVRTIKRYSYASHLKRNPNGLNLIKIEED